MLEKMLTQFNRAETIGTPQADRSEKIGNVGFGLLRIGFGQVVTIERIDENKNKGIVYTEKINLYSVAKRIAALLLAFTLLLPVTVLGAIIGGIATKLSKSHSVAYHDYQLQKEIDRALEWNGSLRKDYPNKYFWQDI